MVQKTYLTNTRKGTRYRIDGALPSTSLPEKEELCGSFHNDMIYKAHQLPPKVDLRSDMTAVENQATIGSCTANALAGAYEYLTKKFNGKNTDVSRLFIYYNARVKDQVSNYVVDSGCTMTSAIKSLSEQGTCLESIWPYNTYQVNSRPNNLSYTRARMYKITNAYRVGTNLHEMKSCLAQGFPFAFGIRLYSSFDQAASKGVVPMPNASDQARQSHGSHAMLAVGYSNQSRAFIVRNSWGSDWGDRGHCYIPYDYMTNPFYTFDAWTVRNVNTKHLGKKHWDKSDAVNYTSAPQFFAAHNGGGNNNAFIETVNENDDNEKTTERHTKKDLFVDPRHQHRSREKSHSPRHHHLPRHPDASPGHVDMRRSSRPSHQSRMMQSNSNLLNIPFNQFSVPRRHSHSVGRVNPFHRRVDPSH